MNLHHPKLQHHQLSIYTPHPLLAIKIYCSIPTAVICKIIFHASDMISLTLL